MRNASDLPELPALSKILDTMHTNDEKINAIKAVLTDKLDNTTSLDISQAGGGPPDHSMENSESPLTEILVKHDLHQWYTDWVISRMEEKAAPLETLPCANVKPSEDWSCPGAGKMSCSVCQLVSYCSKVSLIERGRKSY